MNAGSSRATVRASLLAAFLIIAAGVSSAFGQPQDSFSTSVSEEQAELFIGLLKRRAQRILEAYRAPPPPLVDASLSSSAGYESNVDLDGERIGDTFWEQSGSVAFHPVFKSWLKGDFNHSFTRTWFQELTDSDLWTNNSSGLLQIQPHPRLRFDLGGEVGILNFPRSSDSSFLDRRARASAQWAQSSWLTHKTGWIFQLREYDTRLARDSDGNRIAGLNREDRRHTVLYELQMRFLKLAARMGTEFYRNFSNDQSEEFYDWEDIRFRGVLTYPWGARWIMVLMVSHERKNYQSRSVPTINVAERDNLLTAGGSVLYRLNQRFTLNYSLTYRHQDSNDPRLDFTDWLHQVGVTVSF